jgi:hypothetical protein
MIRSSILFYLASVAVVTIVVGLIYVSVQQNYRSGANDPQAAIAQELVLQISAGKPTERWLSDSIQLEQSLAVFATVYNDQAMPIRSSGFLHGQLPKLPRGVFDFVQKHGEERVTWQPERGVRMAMVVMKSPAGGFIAVGRSLREIEIREEQLRWSVFICWMLAMAIVVCLILVQIWFANKSKSNFSSSINPVK